MENNSVNISPRYRGELRGVEGLERPVQCFGASAKDIETWAQDLLKQHPATATVVMFERYEFCMKIFSKETKQKEGRKSV